MIKKLLNWLRKNIAFFIQSFSILIGIVALALAFIWNKELTTKTAELTVQLTNLSQTVERISLTVEGFPTRPVESYPINIDDIVRDIFGYCNGNDKVRRIEIYTDFVGYGILTDNIRWNDYWGKIKNIIDKNTVNVDWYFYDKELRSRYIDKQFDHYSDKSEELDKFLKECKCKIKKPIDKKEEEQIQAMTNFTSLKTHLNQLLDIKEKNLGYLQANNSNLTINHIKNILPLHAWFVYEEGYDGELVLVRGIMTYPSYGGENTEVGYFSTNRNVLDIQKKAIKANIKERY